MVIDANLECWLCHQSYRLRLELHAGTEIGSPHFWCRHCCAPRTLSRMLKKLINEAQRPASVRNMNADDLASVQKILARLDGSETPARSVSERSAEFTVHEHLDESEDVAA